jgi:hypothetical protein
MLGAVNPSAIAKDYKKLIWRLRITDMVCYSHLFISISADKNSVANAGKIKSVDPLSMQPGCVLQDSVTSNMLVLSSLVKKISNTINQPIKQNVCPVPKHSGTLVRHAYVSGAGVSM